MANKKFEYKRWSWIDMKGLKYLGEEGWELCAAVPTIVSGSNCGTEFYFKREINGLSKSTKT